MKEIYTSKTKLKEFLTRNSLYLKKRYGQNFLYDKNVIEKILQVIEFKENPFVVEAGAGIGNLTYFYKDIIKKAFLFEIDRGFVNILKRSFTSSYIIIYNINFLKANLKKLLDIEKKYIFLSNLPYSSGTQFLFKIIENINFFSVVYVMLPEILLKRIKARPKTKEYCRFTIFMNLYFSVVPLFKVKKSSFFPVPEIDSFFIKLIPDNKYISRLKDIDLFKKFITETFHNRRKKLKNYLNKYKISNTLFHNKRIEELSIEDILSLFE